MRKFNKFTGLILFFLSVSLAGYAQSASEATGDEGPTILYNQQMYGGIHLHSSGYGLNFTWGKYSTAHKIWLYSAEFLYMKHEKEVRSYNPTQPDAKSYVYGKLNSFFVLRPGIGRKKIVADKLRKSGVQIAYSYTLGPALGITKPVYLEIGVQETNYNTYVTERYDPDKHFFDDIYGRAPFINGITELSLYPGGFAKFAFNFEYANSKNRLKGLETGVALDAYFKRIPIMAENIGDLEGVRNKQLFLNFYVNLFFGKKYNKR
ncbi:MAG: hypothetical protein KDC12_04795 [Flavobacteriales bacterium]|nr:hypothetical protein [Flavobacteriales bacterium]